MTRGQEATTNLPSRLTGLALGFRYGYDKYQRTIAEVLLPDGTNVNHTLVKEGWCWWYRKYAPGDTVLEGLETEARAGMKGL
jgi:micrococcal nuclease